MRAASIRDIAEALGISIGTVDRALHGRPEVNAKTRARVLQKAEELGYRPNVAARALKLNRRLRIGAYLPREIASFFDPLRAGVHAAARAATGVNVEMVFRSFPRLDDGEVEMLTADANEPFDGVLLTPGDPAALEPALTGLRQRGIPVVCVASDAPASGRLTCVATDAYVSGAMAAEMLSLAVRGAGTVATITGKLTTMDHAEKLRGFQESLAAMGPGLRLLPAIESHEQADEAYEQALKLVEGAQRPLGIYVSTANSLPVLRALEERELLGAIKVIATDLFPELAGYIETGRVLATLYQRPFTQGKTALELLLRYLMDGTQPQAVLRLAPHMILRSNLCLFADRLAAEVEEAGSGA